MEEMKIRFSLILPLLFILSLCSCATVQDVHKENKHNPKKLLFEDWKYKGFGQSLPSWFEAAYDGDLEKIKRSEKNLSDAEIVLIRGEGINSDQSERNLDLQEQDIPEGYELYDSFWVMTGEGKYVSLALYYKEIL